MPIGKRHEPQYLALRLDAVDIALPRLSLFRLQSQELYYVPVVSFHEFSGHFNKPSAYREYSNGLSWTNIARIELHGVSILD